MRRDGDRLAPIRPNFTRQFTIYDDDDQISIIKGIYKALGLDEKFMQYRAALSKISHAKNLQQTPQDFYKDTTDPKMARLAVVFQRYEEALLRSNALDFDDLLLQSVRLLKHDADLRAIYGRKLQFLTIDEYQDTNRTQYDLVRLLTESHRNVVVVGDEDQSIYGWRGADIRNILDFERDYPNASVIRLEQNYRSTQKILEAAGAVVANNKARKGQEPLDRHRGRANRSRCTRRRMRRTRRSSLRIRSRMLLRHNPDDRVAVLYRTNFQSRQIEEALRRYGRKYIVVGGFSFYQRAEVKDILAYLKVVASPQRFDQPAAHH